MNTVSQHRVIGFVLAVAAVTSAVGAGQDRNAAPVDFAREILPLLSEKCFVCHGPDGTDKEVLRLDSFGAATLDLGGYRAIDPSDPAKSELLARIDSADAPMPPEDADKKLSKDDAIALLSIGDAPRDEQLDVIDHAAWTQLAATVLACDVAITLY